MACLAYIFAVNERQCRKHPKIIEWRREATEVLKSYDDLDSRSSLVVL
jgi:hypothetical protein